MSDGSLRVGEYLDDWLERRRVLLRPTTHQSYRQLVSCYLRPRLGHRGLSDLDRRTLERTYAALMVTRP